MSETDLTAAQLAEDVRDLLDQQVTGARSDGGNEYEMRPTVTAAGHVIDVDLVRLDDGTVARTAKITVELL